MPIRRHASQGDGNLAKATHSKGLCPCPRERATLPRRIPLLPYPSLLRAVHFDHVLLRSSRRRGTARPPCAGRLKLDHLAKVGIINDRAAVELLALLEDHLLVDLGVDSLPSDEKIGQDVRRAGRGCARFSRLPWSRGSLLFHGFGGSGAHLDGRRDLYVALLGANVDVVRLNRVRSVAFLCRLIVVLKGKLGPVGRTGTRGGRSQH